MKVWIVEKGYDYEGYDVQGVYSTERGALVHIAKEAREGSSAKWRHYEMPVLEEPAQPEDNYDTEAMAEVSKAGMLMQRYITTNERRARAPHVQSEESKS